MEQTQDKPRRGRKPAAKTVEKATEKKVAPKPKKSLRRESPVYEAREFASASGRGTFMLMQSGVTIYDERAGHGS